MVLPGGLEEQTQYVYGVSIATGSAIDSNDLLSQTRYPNPVTGIVDDTQDTTQTVNALGQVIAATDRNGTTHTYSYDVLGRLVSDAVTTLGAGVDGAVQRIDYAYDPLGDTVLITSYDARSGGDIVNQVECVYIGLGQLIVARQDDQQRGGTVASRPAADQRSPCGDYTSSRIGSRSSRTYIGRPAPLGNVCDASMPIAR